MPRVLQSDLHWWEKGARPGWDGMGREGNCIVWSRRTAVKHNTWQSFKRDAMILAGYHLIGCDSKALWEFRREQGFRRSEKERKLGGGLVGGWKKKKRSVKRERGSLKDEKMKEAERVRGRKGMRETVAGEILYTCHSLPGSTIPVVEKC